MNFAANKPAAAAAPASPASNKKTNPFVQSLFELVSTCSEDIVGFSPSGTSFEIRNVNALCDVVLTQYFKHKNLSSFFRQLNLYGFSKLPLKNSVHAFQHEFFKRDRPDLLVHVTRVKTANYNNKRAPPAAAATAPQATAAESEEEEDGQSVESSASPSSSTVKRAKRSTKPTSFLNAAFQIASMENHIAGFNLQGTSLEIRDEVAFTTETLPKFFKHSNLSSFVRQLNQYGFEKSASATPGVSHTFFHPHFRRGDIESLGEIARRSKGLSSKVKPIPRLPTPPPTPPPALPQVPVACALPPPHVQQQLSLADGKVRRRPLAFVSNTFALCALENEAIGFSADGTCLEIRSETLLVDTHLETCFKHRNLTSFFRQLNMYGFYKRESPPNVSHTYMHEYFRRGREDLLVLIKRKQVKHALPVLEPDASFAAKELNLLRTQPVTTLAAPAPVEDQYSADNDLLSGLLALVERRESGTT